jgi:hypothetical protein
MRLISARDRKIVAGTIILLAGLGGVWFIETNEFTSWDLRHNLWAPCYLLVHGMNPYGGGAPSQVVGAVWFPMSIGAFLPIGWHSERQVANVWLLGNTAILVMLTWQIASAERPSPIRFGLCLIMVFLFPPVLSHLVLGQFAILAAVMLLLATWLINGGRVLPSGLLIALSLTKPQLAVLAIPGFLIAAIRVGGIGVFLKLVGAITLSVILLTLPLFMVYPSWIFDFLDIVAQTPQWLQPSPFVLLQLEGGISGLVLWFTLATGMFVVNALIWIKLPATRAILWSLALTPLASPYVWSWDLVLLLPLFIHVFYQLKTKLASAAFGLGYLACWGQIVRVRLTTDNSDERFWWVPLAMLTIVCGTYVTDTLLVKRSFEVRAGE